MSSNRMSGNSITDEIRPKAFLISSTSYPVGTLFSVWHNSRNSHIVIPSEIEKLYKDKDYINEELNRYLIDTYPEYHDGSNNSHEIIKNVVKLVIKCDVPASEFVSYEFCIDNANVAWREQLVRARKLHIWMQTSRTADLSTMNCTRLDTIKFFGGEEACNIYNNAVQTIRDAYSKLMELGVPGEDIRLIPQSMTHRVMYGGNLRDVLKIIGKRTSWIAQSTLWAPIIAEMIDSLRSDFGQDIIGDFVGKCEDAEISNKSVTNYKYINENDDRYNGKDPQPCDPLYLAYKKLPMPSHTNIEFYDYLKSLYIKMWSDEVLEVLGWDRNDVNKLGYYDRPINK